MLPLLRVSSTGNMTSMSGRRPDCYQPFYLDRSLGCPLRSLVALLKFPAMRTNQLAALAIIAVTSLIIVMSIQPRVGSLEMGISLRLSAGNGPHRVLYRSWKNCMMKKVSEMREDYNATWKNFGNRVRDCEKPFTQILNVKNFANSDETKRHLFPLQKQGEQVILTVGIGHDTRSEEKLLAAGGNNYSLEFYGADPMVDINEKLYSKFGKFFPFAISADSGFEDTSVLEGKNYTRKTVIHVEAVNFFTKILKKTFIDNWWMDAEGAEYGLFDFFHVGGNFDKNGIVFCQINFEIHKPDYVKRKMIRDFLFQTLDDERYAFFNPVQGNHMRLFFVNFADKECVDKYIPQSFGNYTLP